LIELACSGLNAVRVRLGFEPVPLPLLQWPLANGGGNGGGGGAAASAAAEDVVAWTLQRWNEALAHATVAVQAAQEAVREALSSTATQPSTAAVKPAAPSVAAPAAAPVAAPAPAGAGVGAPSKVAVWSPFTPEHLWSLIALAIATVVVRDLLLK
jgi:hypothetical protein